MTKSYTVHLDALPTFAKNLAKTFSSGDCICLTGEMGSGKTTLSFFLVQAWLGTAAPAFASPTFTIMNQYIGENGRCVNHVDLYRLENFTAFQDLDLQSEWDQPSTLTLVEWGEKFDELKPCFTHHVVIRLDPKNTQQRQIDVQSR